jgi:hypothetical protein
MTIIECCAFDCKFCAEEGFCLRNKTLVSKQRQCELYLPNRKAKGAAESFDRINPKRKNEP